MRYEDWLNAATIDQAVRELRPDYRCALVLAEGLTPGPSDDHSDALLAAAQESVAGLGAPEDLPHMAAWRDAFRAFGAKPQRTRNSAEALLRRASDGLPRIDRITDAYNAVSVLHRTPLGGENVAAYQGPLQLVRAAGDEPFGTLASGAEVMEHPEPGEVVWRDDAGVTCRRWNWRQGYRTRITEQTSDIVFICDVLDIDPGDADTRAAGLATSLVEALESVSPGVRTLTRIVG